MFKYHQIKVQEEKKIGPVRIILINTPLDIYKNLSQPKYDTIFPFGLLALSQIAHMMALSTLIIDGEAARLSIDEIVALTNEINPVLVGINLLSPSLKISAAIFKRIKKEGRILVGGGPHATFEPQDCFNKIPEIDYLFSGEATESWRDFLHSIFYNDHNDINHIQGIISPTSNQKKRGKKSYFIDNVLSVDRSLTIFPFASLHGLRETSIIASIGCKQNCKYCAGRAFSGSTVRYRTILSLVDEIKSCVDQFGISAFHFADDNFLQNHDFLRAFIQELKNKNLSVKWRSFARVDSVTEDIIDLIAESGCYRLTFGIESGNSRTLAHMGKGHTVDDAHKAIELCKSRGIETKSFFMLGYPDETEQELLETIQFAVESKLDWAYFYLVRAFPGTALFYELLRKGFSKSELLNYMSWVPDINKNISIEQNKYREIIEEHKIFNVDTILKYNVAHKRSINFNMSNSKLIELMANAYCQFYFRKEFVDEQMKRKNIVDKS